MTPGWCLLTNYEAIVWMKLKCKSHEQRQSVQWEFTFGNIVWGNLEITLVNHLSGIVIMEMNLIWLKATLKLNEACMSITDILTYLKPTQTQSSQISGIAILNLSWTHLIALALAFSWLEAAITHSRSALFLVHFVSAFLPQLIFCWDVTAWQQCSKSLSSYMRNIWPSVTQINY